MQYEKQLYACEKKIEGLEQFIFQERSKVKLLSSFLCLIDRLIITRSNY